MMATDRNELIIRDEADLFRAQELLQTQMRKSARERDEPYFNALLAVIQSFERRYDDVQLPMPSSAIKWRMWDLNLNHDKLAKEVGASPALISDLVQGRGAAELPAKSIADLARTLGLSAVLILSAAVGFERVGMKGKPRAAASS